ncbi:MAG: hypothetical protein IPM64_17520 [Phycisphaerales bacterium]|nr:hypothetical protein [Phycisphaerales bacterium]
MERADIKKELQAKLSELDAIRSKKLAKVSPLEAEADRLYREVEKAQAAYAAVREKAVAAEKAEGIEEIQRERARLGRAIQALA